MTTLVLVRHGQASFGSHNYDQLSPLGARQSILLGEHWRRIGQRFDAVYAGKMSRQQATARHALDAMGCAEVEVATLPAFDEYDFDAVVRAYFPIVAREHPELALERNKLFADRKLFQLAYERAIAFWLRAHPHEHTPFESWLDFCERSVMGLKQIATPDRKQVAVFTSGGVISVALREALKVDDDSTFRLNWRIFNASVHVLRMGRGGLSLVGFNNIAHLELACDPSLITYR